MAMTLSSPPNTILIGTQVWEIVEHKRKHDSEFSSGSYGYTIEKDNVIVIDEEMPIGMKRVTLFHELLHAVRFVYGGSYKPKEDTTYEDWEHYWIGLYEEPVVQMLRSNPDLAKFLTATEL